MRTNIFLNAYQQPENKLTYNFLSIIELLNSKLFIDFLTKKQSCENPVKYIETVYGGGGSNPDGSINIKLLDNKLITVYYENKTNRRGLDPNQLIGHLNMCGENDLLLVTSPRKSDITIIQGINDSRIIFKTWQEISLFLKSNYRENPIILQFVEYGKKSGEFDELGEIYHEEIKLYSEYLKINFDKKIQSIFANYIHDMDFSKFGFNNLKIQYSDGWGRKGTELFLKNAEDTTYKQFGAISFYYDTTDHQILFKNNLPELVFFFDINPKYRSLIEDDLEFKLIVDNLILDGFESNLNMKLSPNNWRLLIYRKSISELKILNVQEIISFTEKVLSILIKNNAISHNYFLEFLEAKPIANNRSVDVEI